MPVTPPRLTANPRGPTIPLDGPDLREWLRTVSLFLLNLQLDAAIPLPKYTVATVPPVADFEGCMIYVSDESGGGTPAFSDGADWLRVADRTPIS